jgi:hypothetical protein
VGISVSRVGGDAQTKAMRQVAGQLRLDLAQYRELAAFAQFASDLDTATRNQLERGARLTELLKQDKYQPIPLAEQVAVIYAGTQGFVDKVPVARVREWEAGFVRYLRSERADVLAEIDKKKALDDRLFERLKAAISTFNHQFGVEGAIDVADPGAGTGEPPSTPKAEAKPAAKAQPKLHAPEKPAGHAQGASSAGRAQGASSKPQPKAEAEPSDENRPSQLNQIRAAMADAPTKPAPAAGPDNGEPKPKPRKPKAK